MKTYRAGVITILLITLVTLSCRQVWVQEGTSGNGGGLTTDATVVGDITLEDKDGNPIDDSYLADPSEDLIIYPKDENGDTVTDEDLEWVWHPDGGASDGSDDITLTPNEDGSITIPQENLEEGDGTLIVTDPEGGADGSDATQEFPIEVLDPDTQSIQIVGKHYILLNNSITLRAQYQHSSTPGTPSITSWVSSEETQAEASTTNNGTISGKALGKDITITATSSEGKTNTHKVTVYKVSLEHKDGSGAIGGSIESGESITVVPKLEPSGIEAGDVELEYTWEADTGSSGTTTITQNPDGSLTIEGGTTGEGTLVITDGSGNTQEQPLDVTPAGTREITISGPKVVDIDFAGSLYAGGSASIYGEYDKIELTASSTGEAEVDLAGAIWSWSPMDADAEVSEESSTDDTATYKGVKPGTIEVTVEAADGTKGSYEVEVVESTFFTFDLSGVTAESSGAHAGKYRLELPLVHITDWGGNYENWEYRVDWGDGTAERLKGEDYNCHNNSYPVHYYDTAQEYTIRILNPDKTVGLEAWNFVEASVDRAGGSSSWGSRTEHSASELKDIERYGSGKMGRGMFGYCDSITSLSAAGSPVLGENLDNMFRDAATFNQDLSSWEIGSVKYMRGMFRGAKAYNNGGASLSSWGIKVGQVERMDDMFWGAEAFNQDLSSWDVESVKNMTYMFKGATAYTNGGEKLNWTLSSEVVQKNGEYSGYAGYDVSHMYDMFGSGSGLASDLTKHPDGCKCDLPGHKL